MTLRRVLRLAGSADSEPIEALLAFLTATWGLWLANPYLDTFAISPASYGRMAALLAEGQWGTAVAALGLLHVGAVAHGWRRLRRFCAVGVFCLWAFLALLIALSSGLQAAAVPHFALFSVAAGWAYLRIPAG